MNHHSSLCLALTLLLLLGGHGGSRPSRGLVEASVSWDDGSVAMNELYKIVTESLYQQSGGMQLTASYDTFASSLVSTEPTTMLSRFNVDLTAVLQSYFQILLDLNKEAQQSWLLLVATPNFTIPEGSDFSDVTVYNAAVPPVGSAGDFSRQVYETDYYTPEQRDLWRQRFRGSDRLNQVDATLPDPVALVYMVNMTNIVAQYQSSALQYDSLFFITDQLSTSVPARNTHAADEDPSAWTPFRPHYRKYAISAITGTKLVSIIIATSSGHNAASVDYPLFQYASLLIDSFYSADYVGLIVDDGAVRYSFKCDQDISTDNLTLYRAKTELKATLRAFLQNYKALGDRSSMDPFNITSVMQNNFGVLCTSPSSQITIFYLRSTSSAARLPNPNAIQRIWVDKPVNNRLFSLLFAWDSKKADTDSSFLLDLACQNSGVFIRSVNTTSDPEAFIDAAFDTYWLINQELQPDRPMISVGLGWRQESPVLNEGLVWTLTAPVYLPFSYRDTEGDVAVAQPLLGVVGIDFPPKVFADVLFRSVKWGAYAFVVDRQLDVLLHMAMDFFDWNLPLDPNPDPPYTFPIKDYETVLVSQRIFDYRYPTDTHMSALQQQMSTSYYGSIPFPSIHRGYSWSTMAFFDLIGVIVYRIDPADPTPLISFQEVLPRDSICQGLNPMLQYAVPLWDPSSPEAAMAASRFIPPGNPLAVTSFRQDAQGVDLYQRTWNISTGFFEVFSFSSPLPLNLQPFDQARLSFSLIDQNDTALHADPSFGDARIWVDRINDFLSCRTRINPFLTSAVIADIDATSLLFKFWSDSWSNASHVVNGVIQPKPFIQSVWTQNGLYRFWPNTDAISLATHWLYNIISIRSADSVEIMTLPLIPEGPPVTSLLFPIRSSYLNAVLAPPTAIMELNFDYYDFRNYIFAATFPDCATPGVRCYLVDSLMQVVLANIDLEVICSNMFSFDLGNRSLTRVESSLSISLILAGYFDLDLTSPTLLRARPDQIPAEFTSPAPFLTPFYPECPLGLYYLWKMAGFDYFFIAVTESTFTIEEICTPPGDPCLALIEANVTAEEPSVCALRNLTGIQLVCPSTDRSQQVLESLRPATVKCFAGHHLENFQFSDPLAIILYGVYTFLAAVVLFLTILFIKHRHTSVIESSNVIFVFTTLAGTLFASVSVFFWIGEPDKYICIARMWFSVCGFAIIAGMLFSKILYVYLNINDPKVLRIKMPDRYLVAFSVMSIAPQVLIVLIWTIYDPLLPVLEVEDPNFGTLQQRAAQWLCSADSSLGFYLAVYIIQGILILAGAVLTLTTRKTKSIWNESTWIGLTVYISAILYPTVILLRVLIDGTPAQQFLILFVGVFIGIACLLGFVFFTKAWVIFFRSSLNDTAARIADEIDTNFQPNLDD